MRFLYLEGKSDVMIKTETISYSDAEMEYEGCMAYDDSRAGRKPLVLIAHTFRGLSAFEEEKAVALARLGYAAFAIDVYGKGKRAKNPDEAGRFMAELNNNRPLLLERMKLSLKQGMENKWVDPEKVGAIGFCFGGKCVLDLIRSGIAIQGAVTFHGVYDPPGINRETPVQTPLLLLHGWEDPLAPPRAMNALAEELNRKGANWEMNVYGQTGHAFTNPNAHAREDGLFYQEDANRKSWQRMRTFFAEIFGHG